VLFFRNSTKTTILMNNAPDKQWQLDGMGGAGVNAPVTVY